MGANFLLSLHLLIHSYNVSIPASISFIENTSLLKNRGLGKTVVESYNFVSKMNNKYGVSQKVGKKIGEAVDNVESDSETLESIKSSLGSAASKFDELNKEYDFGLKAKQVASSASVLSDAAVGKIDEANKKYNFIQLAKNAVNTAIDKIREAANE